MFTDLRRICEHPTEEDRYWFPDYAGTNWVETLHFAMQNFKDESFISQFLSPKVMRDMKLFAIDDDDLKNHLKVSAIHNEEGYRLVRSTLSAQYNLSNLEPNIQVYNVAVKGDRSLTLRYVPHNRIPLASHATRCSSICISCGASMWCWSRTMASYPQISSAVVRTARA